VFREYFISGPNIKKLSESKFCVRIYEYLVKKNVIPLIEFSQIWRDCIGDAKVFISVIKKLINNSASEDDEESYPIDYLLSYIKKDQAVTFIENTVKIQKKEYVAENVYVLLKEFDLMELFVQYVSSQVNDLESMRKFLELENCKEYIKDKKTQEVLLAIVMD